MQILSYILSLAGLASMIVASLIKGKNMKTILLFVFMGNMFVATSYLITDSINGAVSCYIGAAQTIINYFFDKKKKPLLRWLIASYAVAFVVLNLMTGFSWLCVLAIVASLTFILCIGQKVGSKYRFWTLVNMGLWCLYDVLSGSFGVLFTHGTQLVFAVIGMIIHDRNSKE
ncbi:MAG: YgjV family protein [Clostridia bacterium]|nr:YgjV family protein [Clostridia bacterium]MBQ4601737.1 YgjV family protein [Clostridia bacterium]